MRIASSIVVITLCAGLLTACSKQESQTPEPPKETPQAAVDVPKRVEAPPVRAEAPPVANRNEQDELAAALEEMEAEQNQEQQRKAGR